MTGARAMQAVILVAVLILTLAAGCSGTQGILTGKPGESFTLGIGESARIAGENLVITFDEVTNDSRCPQGVVCIWAGEARSRVTLLQGGTPRALELVQPGYSEQAQETFGAYTITHHLDPYPKEGESIAHAQYRLTLTVTK